MMTINKNQPDFKLITKQRNCARESEDIVITLINSEKRENGSPRKQRVLIHFHNKSGERITKTGYVAFGIDGDRLYFVEAESHEGFKISKSKNEYNGTTQVSDEAFVKWARVRRGAYSLHQDSKSGLHYVQAIAKEDKK